MSERNFILYPAQTHLELFMQMAETGQYSASDIEKCNQAYMLAYECVYGVARGSGKPFIAHLVGTASILVSQRADISVVLAAVMHAVYQRRVPFPGAPSVDERRAVLSGKFGADVELLVYDYTCYEDVSLDSFSESRKSEPRYKEVLAMRLADELEDLAYFALFMHGEAGDREDVKGSYLWRRNNKRRHISGILHLLDESGMDEMTEAFRYWIDAEPPQLWSDSLKSGRYSSFQLA